MTRVLIADDEPDLLRVLQRQLAAMQLEVVAAEDGVAAQAALAASEFDLIITDLWMPRADGFAVLDAARTRWPATPVLIMTGQGTAGDCVRALRAGAFNFLGKPCDPEDLKRVIEDALRSRTSGSDARLPALAMRLPQAALVGESEELKGVLNKVEHVADLDNAVLLVGEKGTGKEAIARLLHVSSRRASRPFVVLRCGTLAGEQLDRELFGQGDEPSKLERARGGTLLLAELDQLDLARQSKLASLLAPGNPAFARALDLRVIADIDRDPRGQLEANPLAAVLGRNLGAITIEMPSLRDRAEDVPLLIEYMVRAANHRLGRQASAAALRSALQSYSWPGNLVELETRVERFVATTTPPEANDQPVPEASPVSALVVPIERLAVTLLLHDGTSREGVVSRTPGRPVQDVLSAPEPFLAVQERDRTRIYARSALACLTVASSPVEDDGALPVRDQAVTVTLRSGAVIEGVLRCVPVAGRARATDILNESGASFALHSEGRVSHVVKAHVLSVEER